jgi:hypothetical protein
MVYLVKIYFKDLARFYNYSMKEFFDIVRKLPYKSDLDKIEILHRPGMTLSNTVKYRDCDDKAILLGAFLYMKKIVFRFIAVSDRPDKKLHHVLIEAILGGHPRQLDATYPQNTFEMQRKYTAIEPISEWIQYV